MPLIWIGISSLAGILTGIVYEKTTEQPIVTDPGAPSFSWWDKVVMAAAGIAAFYVWRKTK